MKRFLGFLFVLYSFQSLGQKPFALVELFTSEGCSSCPPAEQLLSTLKTESEKKRSNVYYLEYHVDYWNRQGWKDPFGSFQSTNRQKNYTSVLNEESLYTPMMVVNGTETFTGSDATKARTAIASALTVKPELQLQVKLDSIAGDTAFVHYESSAANRNYFIRVAFAESKLTSKVGKGENAGKTLAHDAVVRLLYGTGMEKKSGQLKIPLKKFRPNKNTELIGFIQHKQTMKVLAAVSARMN